MVLLSLAPERICFATQRYEKQKAGGKEQTGSLFLSRPIRQNNKLTSYTVYDSCLDDCSELSIHKTQTTCRPHRP